MVNAKRGLGLSTQYENPMPSASARNRRRLCVNPFDKKKQHFPPEGARTSGEEGDDGLTHGYGVGDPPTLD